MNFTNRYAKIQEILFFINEDIEDNHLIININKYFSCSIYIDKYLINFFEDVINGRESEFNNNQICLLNDKIQIIIYNEQFQFSIENNNFLRNEIRNIIKKLENKLPENLDLLKLDILNFLMVQKNNLFYIVEKTPIKEILKNKYNNNFGNSLLEIIIKDLEKINENKKESKEIKEIKRIIYILKNYNKDIIKPEENIETLYKILNSINCKEIEKIRDQMKYFINFEELLNLTYYDLKKIYKILIEYKDNNLESNIDNILNQKIQLEKEYREILLQNLYQDDILFDLEYQTLREYCETSCDLDLYTSRVRRLILSLIFLLEDDNLENKTEIENILNYIEKEFSNPNYIKPEYTIRYIYNDLKKLNKCKFMMILRKVKYFSKFSDLFSLKEEEINSIIQEFLANEKFEEFRVTISLLKTVYQPYWYFNGLLIHKDFLAISVNDHIFQVDTKVHTLYDHNFVKKYGEFNNKDKLYYYVSNYTYDIIEFNKVCFPTWIYRIPSFYENYTFEINKNSQYILRNDSEYIFEEYKNKEIPLFSYENILQEYCDKYGKFDEISNEYYYTSLKDYSCYTHVSYDNKLRSQLIEILLKYQYKIVNIIISKTRTWNDIYYLYELEIIQNILSKIIEKTNDKIAKSILEKISLNFHTKFLYETILKKINNFNEYYWEYNGMLIPNYINYILANDQKSYISKNKTVMEYNYLNHYELPKYLSHREYLETYSLYNNKTQKYYFKPHLKDYDCLTESSLEEKYLYQIIFILDDLNDPAFIKIKDLSILDIKNNKEIIKNILNKIYSLKNYNKNMLNNLINFLENYNKRNSSDLDFTSYDFIQL